jgi:hypothetical protein
MPYTPPSTRRLTLSIAGSGLPDLVMDRAENITEWKRSQVGGYRAAGKTLQGSTKVERAGYRPYFVWTINLRGTGVELALLERMQALLENDPETPFVLRDEFEYVDQLKAAWHQRVIVPDSTVTIGGIQRSFCEFPILLQVDEEEPDKKLGAGRHDLSFSMEEIIT